MQTKEYMIVYQLKGVEKMFKKKQAEIKQGIDSFVGTGTTIDGNIKCQGCLTIDGTVNGDISADGDIIIGTSAVVTGNASADRIIIGGIIEGKVTSKGILRLLSTAKLNGDINVGGFIADEGGMFVGKCSMINPPQKLLESLYVEKRDKDIVLLQGWKTDFPA